MKNNWIFAAFLTFILCAPLAAQSERHHGGGDRMDGNGGGPRDRGDDRGGSDDDSKPKEREKAAQPERSHPSQERPSSGGNVHSNRNPNTFQSQRQENQGAVEQRTNPGRSQSVNHGPLHHFNNGNSQGTTAPQRIQGSDNRGVEHRNADHSSNRTEPRNQAAGPVRHQVSQGMQRIGVKRIPAEAPHRDQFLRADAEHSRFSPPTVGAKGQNLNARLLTPQRANASVIQTHMRTFGMNKTFIAQVGVYNRQETVANHYYWHSWNGTSYCHYYDNWGYHWYGWYWGGHCFWSRWYGNYWWWYDPAYSRWCYWNDNNWWWNDPYHVNVVYVYHDGDYVSSTSTSVDAPAPVAQGPEVDFKSRDGNRTVKVFGEDAFLYDTDQDGIDNKPVYLASSVKEVKFSKPSSGKPMQIMLVLNDGSFEMFDSDGNPYNGPQDQP